MNEIAVALSHIKRKLLDAVEEEGNPGLSTEQPPTTARRCAETVELETTDPAETDVPAEPPPSPESKRPQTETTLLPEHEETNPSKTAGEAHQAN